MGYSAKKGRSALFGHEYRWELVALRVLMALRGLLGAARPAQAAQIEVFGRSECAVEAPEVRSGGSAMCVDRW